MKFNLFLCLSLLFSFKGFTQDLTKEQFATLQKSLAFEKDMKKKAGNLYMLAYYCYEKSEGPGITLDSAAVLNKQCINLSRKYNLKNYIARSMAFDGYIAVKKEDPNAPTIKRKALQYAQRYGFKKEEADAYACMGLDPYEGQITKNISYFQKAATLYGQIGDLYEQGEAFYRIAELYTNTEQQDSSSLYARKAIVLKKRAKRYDLHHEYTLLADISLINGNFKEGLAYALKAEKIIECIKTDKHIQIVIYNLLGQFYMDLKSLDNALAYFEKAIAVARQQKDTDAVISITINTANMLYRVNRASQALKLLDREIHYSPGKECNPFYSSMYLLLHCKLGNYDKARSYYENLTLCKDNGTISNADLIGMYQAMIHYLLLTGQADKTYVYIDKLKEGVKLNPNLLYLAQIERTYFRADSVAGNHLGALKHLHTFKKLNDSIFNIENIKQYKELELKYETQKKDNNIKLLTKQAKLQTSRLHNANIIRYVFTAGIIVLACLAGLLFNRRRLKQRTNTELSLKEQKINSQNNILRKLLVEKELLLKEIHHRVKNNLQIVISLLNTQSLYLDNEDALSALQNSQHRMHAMGIIHQKLYQSDSPASIDMSWYVCELVDYLKESFDLDSSITFAIDAEPVLLDVSQAVELGLICNEAITNAIKHAYKGNSGGKITITLQNIGNGSYKLTVADNGIGLPKGFSVDDKKSVGLALMQKLTDQLNGTLQVFNDKGLTIIVEFSTAIQSLGTGEL